MRAPFWDEATAPFLHGGTYAGHPGACVAGLVNLDIIERERLAERAATLDSTAGRRPLAELPGVADVRSAGLAAAIELDAIWSPRSSTAGFAVVTAARRHGVISRALRGVALQDLPPLIVEEDELVSIVDGLRAAIEETVACSTG